MDNLLNKYLEKIDEISSKEMNQDQKDLAKEILRKADLKNLQNVYQFVVQRVKIGFRFDTAPEVIHDQISLLEKDEKLSFVLDKSKSNQNHLIIGENYDALKNLLVIEKEKVAKNDNLDAYYDVIYIDPPYNTESSATDGNIVANDKEEITNNKFIYRDKFSRNGWLNMMNERLRLARQLLKEDGVIFVSIDDSEQAYLKILMDEIFGEENFVSCIYWRSRTSQNYTDKFISNVGEYILIYSKNKIITKNFSKNKFHISDYKNPDNDPNGPWLSSGIIRNDGRPIYEVISPSGKIFKEAFLYTKENFNILNNQGKIWWGKNGDSIPRKKSYMKDWNGNPYVSFIADSEISNENGTKMLKSIFESNTPIAPKPILLLTLLVNLNTNKNARILDFFAGSGTTGHAVLELNKEDGGSRTFTLVTNNQNNIGINVNYERLFRINHGVGTKNEDFAWANKNEPYKSNLQVFNIKYKNIDPFQNINNEVIDQLNKTLKDFDVKSNKEFNNEDILRSLSSLKTNSKE